MVCPREAWADPPAKGPGPRPKTNAPITFDGRGPGPNLPQKFGRLRLAAGPGLSAELLMAAPIMRPILKLYIALVCASAVLLLAHDLSVLASWPHPWSVGVTIALIVLTALGDQLQFE